MFKSTARNLCIAALLLVGISSCDPASAATPSLVYTEVSEAGETMDAFALRIASRAVYESLKVNGEVCGEFRVVGDGLAIDFYTINNQHHCSYLRLQGETYTRQSYHTHIFIGVGNAYLQNQKINSPRFSADDFAHPGYMTTGRIVLHQSGTQDSVRRVRQ